MYDDQRILRKKEITQEELSRWRGFADQIVLDAAGGGYRKIEISAVDFLRLRDWMETANTENSLVAFTAEEIAHWRKTSECIRLGDDLKYRPRFTEDAVDFLRLLDWVEQGQRPRGKTMLSAERLAQTVDGLFIRLDAKDAEIVALKAELAAANAELIQRRGIDLMVLEVAGVFKELLAAAQDYVYDK